MTRMKRALIVLGAPVVLLAACGDDQPATDSGRITKATALVGYALKPPSSSADVTVPEAASGEPVQLVARPGGLLFVYFGYTNCPDVCPTSLAAIKAALARVTPERAAKVDLVMITVDPQRDTAAVLPGYVQSFDPSWKGLRTEDAAVLAAAAERFGVSYAVTTAADGTVEVSHTGTAFVVDETGEIVDSLLFGVTPKDVANDITYLLPDRR